MNTVLIHAPSLVTGGGKYIIDNFLENFIPLDSCQYYIIIPKSIKKIKHDKVIYIRVSDALLKQIFLPLYYFIYLPFLLRRKKIDFIWNFGDIIVPRFSDQIYFFDWAYAVYDEQYIWSNMKWKEKVVRKIKVGLISLNIKGIKGVVVQSENMKQRLSDKFGLKNIDVFPTPIWRPNMDLPCCKFMKKETVDFLYVSSFSSHKNHKILIDVARLIKKSKHPFRLLLTMDHSQSITYMDEVSSLGLNKIILNLGKLEYKKLQEYYFNANAAIIPSLLESYGLPYYEAMHYRLPILASDLDFSRESCENFVYYFDPFDSESILEQMIIFTRDDENRENLTNLGIEKLNKIPDWETFIKFINEVIFKNLYKRQNE